MNYDEWIAAYVKRHSGNVWMKCLEACEEMVQAFPELELVKGIAISSVSGKRWCHCWCVTDYGKLLDPTASQFGHPVTYEHPKGHRLVPPPPSTARS